MYNIKIFNNINIIILYSQSEILFESQNYKSLSEIILNSDMCL